MKFTKKMFSVLLVVTLLLSVAAPVMAQTVTMYSADGRTKQVSEDKVEANKAVGWYTSKPVKMYAKDGRTKTVAADKVEANKAVGWYTSKPITVYSLDGRKKTIGQDDLKSYEKVGWYKEPPVKMYAPDGRTKVVAKSKVSANEKVGWSTKPIYKADGSLSKPFLANNSNTIDYYMYSSENGKIIFNVTGYARGDKAEAIGGLENAEDDQEWILLKVKVKHLAGQNEITYFYDIYDWLYNKSGSKYSVYDKEYSFGYSWNKEGDIYNKGIGKYSTFAGGSMEGYVAVLTDAGAKMPIIKIPTKDGNMFVSTVGAPELTKKTKEEKPAEDPVLSKCKLILPTVPTTLSNSKTAYTNGSYKDVLQSKFTVSEITYEFKESSGGKVDLYIYYKGQKTYDVNGAGQTSACKIGWKLYDSEDYVVKDGTTQTLGLAMNEKFKDVKETVYSLETGTYKLVIMGVNGY